MPKIPVTIGNTTNNIYNMTLKSISYVGLFDYVNVTVCGIAKLKITPLTNTTAPTAASPTINLTIHNSNIMVTGSLKNMTVQIIANGNVISTGTGMAVYNGSNLPAGSYRVTGVAPLYGITTLPQTFTEAFRVPLLSFPRECTNNTFNRVADTCLTTANISTKNSQLSANLYLNRRLVGNTYASISNLTSKLGNYTYVFNTTGNAYYAANSISYSFAIVRIGSSRGVVPSPGLIALIIGIAIAIAAAGAYTYNRSTAHEKGVYKP
jgi:hypothetical protein